ncbi:glycerophosphoryl diester phosphodiesterase [Psychromicrobium silvestre]|uniref:Glycerophosphoryl diester phosphodiesterase n=1 Tax=Psychromicrobium silvestre TaxID=1645614 RepID=A0A7Y9S8L6_9MICC|nr:glycerophosphodiester phosphodiesterase family protein [Psychromicrobium silvestre]NYE96111.1 glycerophosphoryl diester phosphodiesterase [Psychromicrobium silvestre]
MTLIYAHRGSSARYAEHTRAAYLQAIADGADGVECDVHLTADRQVVLLHDSTLDRTSNGTGAVAEKTLSELRDLDFSSWKGVDVPDEYGSGSQQFLTLEELLDILLAAGRPIGLAIEFKHPNPFGDQLEELTVQLLLARGWLPQSSSFGNLNISFMSFDPDAIHYLRRTVPARQLCQLVTEVKVEDLAKELGSLAAGVAAGALKLALAEGQRILDEGEAEIAGPGIDYLRSHTEQARQWLGAGRTFRVWTVDEAEDARFCLGLGVQEITTNKPAEIRALL